MSGPGPWLAAALAVSVVFGGAGPALSRRIPPAPAVWLLSVGGTVVAAASVVAPALVLLMVVGQWPLIAGHGHWSARFLASRVSADGTLAVTAALILAVQAVRLGRTLYGRGRELVTAWMACRGTPTELVVIPDVRPVAFALPGWPGRVVASRGMLQQLPAAERRAVLAHEQGHLHARHDLHLFAGALATAVDPLLWRVPAALRLATERSADETSAATTGDRRLVALAIGTAAGMCSPGAQPAATMGATGADVALRVRSLLGGPVPRRLPLQAVLAALAVAAVAVAGAGTVDTKHLFELAERAHTLVRLRH